VAGLRRNDFGLLDRGKPQKIPFLVDVRDRRAKNRGGLAAGAGVSNRNGDRVNIPPSVAVILLDLLNTAFDD
jgi:hypothetical protein